MDKREKSSRGSTWVVRGGGFGMVPDTELDFSRCDDIHGRCIAREFLSLMSTDVQWRVIDSSRICWSQLYRLFLIWDSQWWIMVFPGLAYLAAFGALSN